MHACAQVLSDAAVLKRQAREIEELRRVLAANGGGCAASALPSQDSLCSRQCAIGDPQGQHAALSA
jgi:hypothetical protein